MWRSIDLVGECLLRMQCNSRNDNDGNFCTILGFLQDTTLDMCSRRWWHCRSHLLGGEGTTTVEVTATAATARVRHHRHCARIRLAGYAEQSPLADSRRCIVQDHCCCQIAMMPSAMQ